MLGSAIPGSKTVVRMTDTLLACNCSNFWTTHDQNARSLHISEPEYCQIKSVFHSQLYVEWDDEDDSAPLTALLACTHLGWESAIKWLLSRS